MRKTILPGLFALSLALPAAATDIGQMTEAERAAFRAEVRAYLLDNPEVLMEAIGVLEQRQASAAATSDQQMVRANAEALFASPDDWVDGNPEGDVTLVAFMDYRCSYCRKAYPEVADLLAVDGNIRLVIKEFPILGPQSVLAARFALAVRMVAGDAAYGQVHDSLMTLRGEINAESLTALAGQLGLDAAAIVASMEAPEINAALQRTQTLAQAMQINGTPTFVLGDQMLRGYVPGATMAELVDELRASR